jgi:Ribbon-helix-helix protein, copG family
MIRTQISLTEGQMDALRREAERRQTSIAAVVRDAVDAELARDERRLLWDRAMEVVGKYQSGHPDIGQNHDLYLDPDYEP